MMQLCVTNVVLCRFDYQWKINFNIIPKQIITTQETEMIPVYGIIKKSKNNSMLCQMPSLWCNLAANLKNKTSLHSFTNSFINMKTEAY